MKRKYPAQMFWIGLIGNILVRFGYLTIPGIILCIVGIWVTPCLWIGLIVLCISLALSVIDQLQIRKTILTPNDNPDIDELFQALTGPGGIEAFGAALDKQIAAAKTNETDVNQE